MIAYKWNDLRNVVGFAAECARAVLPKYTGDHRDAVVKAIEVAEAYAARGEINTSDAHAAVNTAYDAAYASNVVHNATCAAAHAAYVAAHAAYVAANAAAAAAAAANAACNAAENAAHAVYAAGAATAAGRKANRADPTLDIELIQFKWIAKDLGVPLTPAGVGALSIPDVALACEVGAA